MDIFYVYLILLAVGFIGLTIYDCVKIRIADKKVKQKNRDEALDILARWSLRYGFKPGRDIWSIQSKDMQEKELERFNRDLNKIKTYIELGDI